MYIFVHLIAKISNTKQILSFHTKLRFFIVGCRIFGLESTQILDGNVVVGLATTFPPERKVIPHRSDSLLSSLSFPGANHFQQGTTEITKERKRVFSATQWMMISENTTRHDDITKTLAIQKLGPWICWHFFKEATFLTCRCGQCW